MAVIGEVPMARPALRHRPEDQAAAPRGAQPHWPKRSPAALRCCAGTLALWAAAGYRSEARAGGPGAQDCRPPR